MFETDLPRRISNIHSSDEIPVVNGNLSPDFSKNFANLHNFVTLSPNNRFIYNPVNNEIRMRGKLITIERTRYEVFTIPINGNSIRSSYIVYEGKHRALWLIEEKTREFLQSVAAIRRNDASKFVYLEPYTRDVMTSALSIATFFSMVYWDALDAIYEDSRRLDEFLKMELLL